MKPSEYPTEYYSFDRYITKHRILTYWYQIREVLELKPESVLEIGVGTGLVAAYLRNLGIRVTTLDINPTLNSDYVGSVLEADQILRQTFDVVLCARVLHHLPFAQFSMAMEKIASVSASHAVITLPIEDMRFYLMTRYTASPIRVLSLPLPLTLKKWIFQFLKLDVKSEKFRSGQWKINDFSGIRLNDVVDGVSKNWIVKKQYRIPEDASHFLMVLQKRDKE